MLVSWRVFPGAKENSKLRWLFCKGGFVSVLDDLFTVDLFLRGRWTLPDTNSLLLKIRPTPTRKRPRLPTIQDFRCYVCFFRIPKVPVSCLIVGPTSPWFTCVLHFEVFSNLTSWWNNTWKASSLLQSMYDTFTYIYLLSQHRYQPFKDSCRKIYHSPGSFGLWAWNFASGKGRSGQVWITSTTQLGFQFAIRIGDSLQFLWTPTWQRVLVLQHQPTAIRCSQPDLWKKKEYHPRMKFQWLVFPIYMAVERPFGRGTTRSLGGLWATGMILQVPQEFVKAESATFGKFWFTPPRKNFGAGAIQIRYLIKPSISWIPQENSGKMNPETQIAGVNLPRNMAMWGALCWRRYGIG